MRRPVAALFHTAVIMVAVGATACGRSTGPSEAMTEQQAVSRARAALGPFKKSLMGALKKGLAEGPAAAVRVCRQVAPELAATAAEKVEGVTIGRTSDKLRNPGNAARDWMKPILAEFEAAPKKPDTFRAVALEDGRWGYAEPIYVKALCLTCHGTELGDEVGSALARHYPRDAARGYQEGDLRGAFWAEVVP